MVNYTFFAGMEWGATHKEMHIPSKQEKKEFFTKYKYLGFP